MYVYTYGWWSNFKVTWFFELIVKKSAVTQQDLSASVLDFLELIFLIDMDNVFISGESQKDSLSRI